MNDIRKCKKKSKKSNLKILEASENDIKPVDSKRFDYLGCINRAEHGSGSSSMLNNNRSSVGKLSIRRRRKHNRSSTVEWVIIKENEKQTFLIIKKKANKVQIFIAKSFFYLYLSSHIFSYVVVSSSHNHLFNSFVSAA